jgi:hypothetical protein
MIDKNEKRTGVKTTSSITKYQARKTKHKNKTKEMKRIYIYINDDTVTNIK